MSGGFPEPRDASAVVLVRRHAETGRLELYWVRRAPALSYLGGFHALPGGALERGDKSLVVQGAAPADAPAYVAAVRELFEETGILVARGAERLSAAERTAARRALLDEEATLGNVVDRHGLTLDASAFLDAGRWVTPPFSHVRFDTRFFLVRVPAGQITEIWPGELVEGEWIEPARALERWREGNALLTPPTLHVLETAAAVADGTQAVADADLAALLRDVPAVQRGPSRRIEMRPGIFLVPLRSPTLPPATHTNCYVVGGRELVVVDPGSPEPDEQDALERFLLDRVAEGRSVRAILVTHHHRDHWLGAERVRERFDAPILADPLTVERVPVATGAIGDGATFDLPGHAGTPLRRLRALRTPGHTRGHLCFLEEETSSLLAGDMMAGTGTVVIDPPDGNMTAYMESLDRLARLPLTVLLPGHGAPTGAAMEKIAEYVAHRVMREDRIRSAIAAGASSLGAIVAAAYTDVAPAVHPLAARSALAHVEKLIEEGHVTRRSDGNFAPAVGVA